MSARAFGTSRDLDVTTRTDHTMTQQYFQFSVFERFATAECERHSLSLNEMAHELTARENVTVNPASDEDLADKERSDEIKKKGSAFSCSVFHDDVRGLENVIEASMIALDFDGSQHKALSPDEFDSVLDDIRALGHACIWFETWNLGLRAVFPFSRPVSTGEYTATFDMLRTRFRLAPDKTGRGPERLHAAPQVPSEARRETHRAGFFDGPLLDAAALAPAPSAPPTIFTGLKFPERVSGPRCASFADLQKQLSNCTLKNETMLQTVSSLAWQAAERGADQARFADDCWAAAQRGLKANTVSAAVKSWTQAEDDCRRFVRKAFEDYAAKSTSAPAASETTAAPTASEALPLHEAEAIVCRAIPKSKRDLVDKLIRKSAEKGGSLVEAGTLLGRYAGTPIVRNAIRVFYAPRAEMSDQMSSAPDARARFLGAFDAALPPTDWRADLVYNEKGHPCSSDENALHVLRAHPDSANALVRNVRVPRRAWLTKEVPWSAATGAIDPESVRGSFAAWAREQVGCDTVGFKRAHATIQTHVYSTDTQEIDPLLDWFESLPEKQETSTLDVAAEYVFGDASPAAAKFVRWWCTQLCVRTLIPGAKADYVLVLVSENQGSGKTSTVENLFPAELGELVADVDIKDDKLPLKLSELAVGLLDEIDQIASRHDSSQMKKILSQRQGLGHVLFVGHQMFKRRAVFIGTSNHADFAYDPTGARRYWPITVTNNSVTMQKRLREIREDLWAEAFSEAKRCVATMHLPIDERHTYWPSDAEHDALCAPAQEALTMRETTASAALRDLMDDLPSQLVRSPIAHDPLQSVKIYPGQMKGTRLIWVTLNQIGALLNLSGQRTNSVKDTIAAAGLRKKHGTKRYYRIGEEDMPDATEEKAASRPQVSASSN